MTRVILVDDHRMVREGLRKLLEAQGGFEVVGEAENGRDALTLLAEQPADVVVMDVSMGELNGIDATRLIREATRETKVIALSMHSDRRFVTEMLRAGASGYVLKDAAFEELFTAIREVMAGRDYLSPLITHAVVNHHVRLDGVKAFESAFVRLSPREREILQLVAEGKPMKQIGSMLNISIKTVETHRRSIMEKLGIYSVAELTKYAIREGLTTVEVEAAN